MTPTMRALRAIPMGQLAFLLDRARGHTGRYHPKPDRNCKLNGIDVYTYLVDVLQRVSQHPAKDVIDLTPHVWKTKFAHNPKRSDIALADQ